MTAVIPGSGSRADHACMQTPATQPDRADPFGPFRRDHARVLGQLDVLEPSVMAGAEALDEALLGRAVALLRSQFATHMAAEESALYPAIQSAFPAGRSTLEALRADHAELRLMLAAIAGRLGVARSFERDEQLRVVLRDLIDLLRLHIHREESAVFDVALRVLSTDEAAELARRVASLVDASSPPGGEPGPAKGTES